MKRANSDVERAGSPDEVDYEEQSSRRQRRNRGSDDVDSEDPSSRRQRGNRGSSTRSVKSLVYSPKESVRSHSVDKERIQFSLVPNVFEIRSTGSPTSSGSIKHWRPPATTWGHQSSFPLSKWIPEAFFRPIRFESELSYIRYGGRGYQLAAWVIAVIIILLSTIYFSYCTIAGVYNGNTVLPILATALALLWFFYVPLFYVITTLIIVYHAKWCNLESHILELRGLPINNKRINHIRFMNKLTQPEYHPQKTEKLVRLHKHT
uniref:Uncharacterized protein n=1 Tax=Lygus hesperus TaxID=30085 RepID=A0A0A9X6W0_LYGHE